jgi:hypothetical protein
MRVSDILKFRKNALTAATCGEVYPHTFAISDEDFVARDTICKMTQDEQTGATRLLSVETTSSRYSIASVALEHSEAFLGLVGKLPPLIQDVLIQYYLLGKTYNQICAIVLPERSTFLIHKAHHLGVRALGAIVEFGGKPTRKQAKQRPELSRYYDEMIEFSEKYGSHESVRIEMKKALASFEIVPNGQLKELFAPEWSVLESRGAEPLC